jgi:hypothetical protein
VTQTRSAEASGIDGFLNHRCHRQLELRLHRSSLRLPNAGLRHRVVPPPSSPRSPKNLELWIWFLVAFVVGIPACAQLNCWIEKKRDECDRKSRDDAHAGVP